MNWVAIDVNISVDEKTLAVARHCKVTHAEAVGLVVSVIAALPRIAPSGNISDITDVMLEGVAMWEGKRGRFAEIFRTAWCTAGVVTAWEKWNGAKQRECKAKAQRAKEWRDRKKAERESDTVSDTQPDTILAPYTRNNRQVTKGSYKQEEEDTSLPHRHVPPEVFGWVATRGHDALQRLLDAVPEPDTWIGILRGYASGLSMDQNRSCDPERLAAAIEDFVAKSKHREPGGASPKLFRAFVKSARAPIKQYDGQRSEAEERAEQLLIIRENNERKRRRGKAPTPEPTWAAEIDALFPDGRTFPAGVAA